ncbi:MAG: SDR family oxidoreductase, partial [Streptosporangiales bacterium]
MSGGESRAAFVLAGTKGIGRGCAEALARAGFRVAVCARSRDDVDATVDALEELGVEATGTVADVSDPVQLEAAFATVDEAFGRLDVLVANAGGPPPGTFDALDDDAWQAGYELTFMSAVRSIRLAVRRMRQRGYGRILVIGSSSARRPIPGLTLSNAYRPALAGLTKSLAVELAPDGITVNMVSPGRIDTDRVHTLDARAAERQGTTYEEVRAASQSAVPIGRYGSVDEIGALVAFLASEAAGYVTGQTPLVDG